MPKEELLIGRLEIEPIRKVFPKEAHNFTAWLAEHIEVLGERLGLDLTVVQREMSVGDFNVDLLCEVGDGRAVIVENQLEPTNHDHLGKLLTYLVNLEAAAAIWVTSFPRPEHQKVIDWLNESTPANISFFLVKIEAVRILGSPPAPLFTIVAAPDAQGKVTGHEKKEWAERHVKRMKFWTGLLARANEKNKLFAGIKPGREHWLGKGAGKSGITFNYNILMDGAAVDIYIDHDQETGNKNKIIFDALHGQKDQIEKEFGEPLDWQRLDDKRASRIVKRIPGSGLSSPEDTWPDLQDKMIDAMTRFVAAIRPRLAKIEV